MTILVTGGAGYIGSFMTKRLIDDGHSVIVIDNLIRGNEKAVDSRAIFKRGSLENEAFLNDIFTAQTVDAVIHFAGFISMAESMKDPGLYFHGNTFVTVQLLEQMRKHDIKHIIFSSTAGVYGNPTKMPIPEDHIKQPTNPYGESKLLVEQILRWYQQIYNISSVCLRYFNAAGAALDGSNGEKHDPESHLIPLAIKAALHNEPVMLYGEDYNTSDGTCIRDYIHVLDLIDAHVKALAHIQKAPGGYVYNVGTGKGYSNKEVIATVKEVSGIDFPITTAGRRPGDADILVADATRIMRDLQFAPQYSDLKTIVRTAWEWHKRGNV